MAVADVQLMFRPVGHTQLLIFMDETTFLPTIFLRICTT